MMMLLGWQAGPRFRVLTLSFVPGAGLMAKSSSEKKTEIANMLAHGSRLERAPLSTAARLR